MDRIETRTDPIPEPLGNDLQYHSPPPPPGPPHPGDDVSLVDSYDGSCAAPEDEDDWKGLATKMGLSFGPDSV